MIEVITGPMFSGKTEELIRRIRRLEHFIPRVSFKVYKPRIDTRSNGIIKTHYGSRIVAEELGDRFIDLAEFEQEDWIVIDEFQFVHAGLVPSLIRASENNINILVAGLALDSRGEPFGSMPIILPYADRITTLTAICKQCGAEATKTQRKEAVGGKVMIGGEDMYEARCASCWRPR